jgi:drug/metabolite transporter (DMT)-like permease
MDQFSTLTASADPMNLATVDDLSTRSNSVSSGSWRTAQGVVWGSLSVAILSGWFVVTRLGLRQDLRVWDIIALRFGEGAILLTPALFVGSLRLRFQAWSQGIVLAVLWGAPFILLVGLGLQATSAPLTSSVTPALMPVFAGLIAWTVLAERPRRRQLYGYGLIVAGLLALIYGYVSAEGHLDVGGVAALVTAAVMWALYALRLRQTGLTSLQAAALICFWSAILYLPLYIGLDLSKLTRASAGELLFQSVYQGVLMSVVAVFAFNRAIVLLGPRATAAIIALVPVTATLLAIPVLGEWPSWPSAAAVCVIALGVILAAASGNEGSKEREKADDPLLFPPDTQSGKGRVDVGGNGLGLSGGPGRHRQGRTAYTAIPRH